jgi:tripartite-type tricarboxylate transporter receptor subunit TctC
MANLKLPRRAFLQLVASAAALPAVSHVAMAQVYPTRPIRIVVGSPAGGPQDIAARLIGQSLSERLGQQFIVENRPGAGTNLGAETVVRAAPDGYTLLLCASPNAINTTLYNLSFNFIRDIAPVASLLRVPLVLIANVSVPVKSVPELIAYAKANPGKVNMASGGIGTPAHVAGELFKMLTGTNAVHVPYRGTAPMLTDLLGGSVQVAFDPLSGSLEHIRAGRLRALALTTATRQDILPDVPSLSEFLPDYEASVWYGLGAPRSTSAEIIRKLNSEISAVLAEPKMKARIIELGGAGLVLSPPDFGKLIADETEKWAKVIRAANIKPE